MRIIPFEATHLAGISPQPAQYDMTPFLGLLSQRITPFLQPHLSFSAEEGGIVVGCGGVLPQWSGVGIAWTVLSEAALGRPIAFARAVARTLVGIEEKGRFRRIQASVADGHGEGHRFAEFLGFVAEGFMHNYGMDGVGDYWLYARFKR